MSDTTVSDTTVSDTTVSDTTVSEATTDRFPVRTLRESDWKQMHAVIETAFLGVESEEEQALDQVVHEFDRSLGAFDGDRLVGLASAYTFEMSVPGGRAPVAGVTWVGVLATHRRQGVLTSLMRRQLRAFHDDGGEAIAALWASEPGIYGRFGYGAASRRLTMTVSRDPGASAGGHWPHDPALRLRLIDGADSADLTDPVYRAVAARRPGMPLRNEGWRRRSVADVPALRHGRSALRCLLAEDETGVRGYARYQTDPKWDDPGPAGVVHVREVMAADPAAYAAVWRYLLDLDLTGSATLTNQPLDDPILELLPDPRRALPGIRDGLFVRLVDVERALAARTYADELDVVLEVDDAFCPWNSGRWRLAGGSSGATCTATGDAADLALRAADLGAAFLGGNTLVRLAGAGRVTELRKGSLAAASRAFAHDPLPWCPFVF